MADAARHVLLVADDFAITEGVSAGIAQLARAHRISGTSALVTLDRWRSDGALLAALRSEIAIGLHINLTLGAPLTSMRTLARGGEFPKLAPLIGSSLLRRLDRRELEEEITRQLERFASICGHAPDFIDGHQHVHALPVVRDALIDSVRQFYQNQAFKPLVRVPGDRMHAVMGRAGARSKGLLLAALSTGFSGLLGRCGLPANDSFAGVSGFGESEADVARDFASAVQAMGRLHLVMCHPGLPTPELAAFDPITTRRRAELAVLSRDNVLSAHLWHPVRDAGTGAIDWTEVGAVAR
jgi:predicted glycoside hydrolase/deacetylase ChbG (UPF0249 family)